RQVAGARHRGVATRAQTARACPASATLPLPLPPGRAVGLTLPAVPFSPRSACASTGVSAFTPANVGVAITGIKPPLPGCKLVLLIFWEKLAVIEPPA
ncbi:hypothetical protein, partial [Dickeya dadantii]|uniref:hypothetical protein n=1 Tax=Dickeya dadantii TaxID=204038 RepID=UPI00265730A4